MRLDDKLAKIEQAMMQDNEHCSCPDGWMVEHYRDGEPEPARDGQLCNECGRPRGRILVKHVTGRRDNETDG